MKGKIILLPISSEQCKGKKILFRPSGMYHVVSEQSNRIVLRHEGSSVTQDMTKFNGFLQPVAFFPELPQDEQFVPIAESDWVKVNPLLKVDSLGLYIHSGNNPKEVYDQPLIELNYNFVDDVATV